MSVDFSSDEDIDDTLSQVSEESSPFPPLFSLPPEMLYEVLDALPPHPSHERTSTLLSLSRVCRKLADVARKLLYRSIDLCVSIDYEDTEDDNTQLVQTLVEKEECALAVRNLRITFGEEPDRTEFLHFSYVLSRLTRLRRIYTGWEDALIGPESEEVVECLCQAVARNARHLEALELPNISLTKKSVGVIFESLTNLNSFTHRILRLRQRPVPKFKLRNLIFTSQASQAAFNVVTASSLESLTSLSLSMHWGKYPHSLEMLPNLSTLHLSFYDRAGDDDKFNIRSPEGHEEWVDAIAYRLRTLLMSIHTLKLSISSSLVGRTNRLLLLPPDPALSPCPLLRQITILPPGYVMRINRVTYELTKLVAEAILDQCFERRIKVVLAISRGGSFDEKDALDPQRRSGW